MNTINLEIYPGLQATISYRVYGGTYMYVEIINIFVGDKIDITYVVCDRLTNDWEEEIRDRLREEQSK